MSSVVTNLALDDEMIVGTVNNLSEAESGNEYVIRDIVADDEELKGFLFSLGCYKGETISLVSILANNYVITVKDARYSIDSDLAEAILV